MEAAEDGVVEVTTPVGTIIIDLVVVVLVVAVTQVVMDLSLLAVVAPLLLAVVAPLLLAAVAVVLVVVPAVEVATIRQRTSYCSPPSADLCT